MEELGVVWWSAIWFGFKRICRIWITEDIRKNFRGRKIIIKGFRIFFYFEWFNDFTCFYYFCFLFIKCLGINKVCFWKFLLVLEKEIDICWFIKVEVGGKFIGVLRIFIDCIFEGLEFLFFCFLLVWVVNYLFLRGKSIRRK